MNNILAFFGLMTIEQHKIKAKELRDREVIRILDSLLSMVGFKSTNGEFIKMHPYDSDTCYRCGFVNFVVNFTKGFKGE
jgi:hypothetical protein